MTSQDERYIRIARACLKAINQISTASGDTQKNVQEVYNAIDAAFRMEFVRIEESQQRAVAALREIKTLDPREGLEQARKIATEAINAIEHHDHSGKAH